MKTRVMFILVLALCLALSLATAQTKEDCSKATASGKASCCAHGTKASMSSNTKMTTPTHASIVTVGDKAQCVKGSKECMAMEAKNGKACPEMTKASMKMDCCKTGATKASQAKNSIKKSTQEKTVEAKGTN